MRYIELNYHFFYYLYFQKNNPLNLKNIAGKIKIPLDPIIILLNIAEEYCKIDVCPYLKCKFVTPIIKLFSFKIFIYVNDTILRLVYLCFLKK